ncbi:MAG: hypothetical protein ACM31L_05350 [Actinomycetota bacterium]
MRSLWFVVALAPALLGGCGTNEEQKAASGGLGGVAAGALIGGPVGAVIGGAAGAGAGTGVQAVEENQQQKAQAPAERR